LGCRALQAAGSSTLSPSGMSLVRAQIAKKRSEEHTSELQSRFVIVCRLLHENDTTHERLWFRGRIVTHAAAEWAMDAHIARHLLVRPATLIVSHRERLVDFASLPTRRSSDLIRLPGTSGSWEFNFIS